LLLAAERKSAFTRGVTDAAASSVVSDNDKPGLDGGAEGSAANSNCVGDLRAPPRTSAEFVGLGGTRAMIENTAEEHDLNT